MMCLLTLVFAVSEASVIMVLMVSNVHRVTLTCQHTNKPHVGHNNEKTGTNDGHPL